MKANPSIALKAAELYLGYERKGHEPRVLAADVELTLRHGEFVCIIGPNGSGKSTLIRALAGMASPLSGRVEVGGANLGALTPRQRARRISVALTGALPIGMYSVRSLVALGRHPHTNWMGSLEAGDRERIKWALEAVGAWELADRMIGELSDGERQKVVVARALAQDAGIILLDEPTAFLDLPRRVELMRSLRDLAHAQGLGVAISTHDLDLALRCADQLWLVGNGSIRCGMPEDLALDGSLAVAFATENLDWDDAEGAFRMHRDPCLFVALEGEGITALWTRRALARIGYGLVEGSTPASVEIAIDESDRGKVWMMRRGTETRSFRSLESLIDCLRPLGAHGVHPLSANPAIPKAEK